eukprot:jgi/Mesvir1/24527/Mv25996-RA.1
MQPFHYRSHSGMGISISNQLVQYMARACACPHHMHIYQLSSNVRVCNLPVETQRRSQFSEEPRLYARKLGTKSVDVWMD